jgi:hypothetical protein
MNNGRDFNYFSNNHPQNWQNQNNTNSTTSRTETSINDILDSVRELLNNYNENIRSHNHIVDSYNSNIFGILNLLQILLDHYLLNQRNSSYRNSNNNFYTTTDLHNNFNSNTRRRNINENRQNFDISSLIYLLSLPSSFEAPLPRNLGLTHLQFEEFTQTIHYDETMNENRCAITLDEFVHNEEICKITACGHYFKRIALLRWFDNHTICPVCRFNLIAPISNSSTTENIDLSMNDPINNEETNDPELIPLFSSNNIPSSNSNSNSRSTSTSRSTSRSNSSPIHNLSPLFENIFNSFTHTQRQGSTQTSSRNNGYQQLARIISDVLMEQSPTYDSSQNLLFTLEIPIPDTI